MFSEEEEGGRMYLVQQSLDLRLLPLPVRLQRVGAACVQVGFARA